MGSYSYVIGLGGVILSLGHFDASNRKVRRNRSGGRPAGSERMAMRSAAAAEKQGGRYGELGLASQELHRNLFII